MPVQFRNLVFEGGGVKGIAYLGAMQVLEQRGDLAGIRRVGGTSAGAINALLFALEYTNDEQRQLLSKLDFNKFKDNSPGIFRDFFRVKNDYGWNKGDYFSKWIEELIAAKLGKKNATFADLKNAGMPDFYAVGTNLSSGYAEVFSHEQSFDMPLSVAVRISMSIPLFFAAKRFGTRKDVFVDGGVQLNYPVKLFDRMKYINQDEPEAGRETGYYTEENGKFLKERPGRSPYVYNRQTLGFRLDTQDEIGLYRYDEPMQVDEQIASIRAYSMALLAAVMNAQEHMHLHSDDWHRTVYINTLNVKTTDFDLSEVAKASLFDQGIKGATAYFEWFDTATDAHNKIVSIL